MIPLRLPARVCAIISRTSNATIVIDVVLRSDDLNIRKYDKVISKMTAGETKTPARLTARLTEWLRLTKAT